jgi:hypothetical protein
MMDMTTDPGALLAASAALSRAIAEATALQYQTCGPADRLAAELQAVLRLLGVADEIKRLRAEIVGLRDERDAYKSREAQWETLANAYALHPTADFS